MSPEDVSDADAQPATQPTAQANAPAEATPTSAAPQVAGSAVDERWRKARRPVSGLVADVVPWAGRAVVFPHRVLHESMPIGEGSKAVMRGDVLCHPL